MDSTRKIKLRNNLLVLSFLAFAGLFTSIYALLTELRHDKDPNYRPLCDINQAISCTAALMSSYGKGLGLFPQDSIFNIPNPIFGIVNYITLIMLINFSGKDKILITIIFYNSIFLNLLSIYLAYILYLLKTLCVVCLTIYIVNFLLLIFSYKRKMLVAKLAAPKKD